MKGLSVLHYNYSTKHTKKVPMLHKMEILTDWIKDF